MLWGFYLLFKLYKGQSPLITLCQLLIDEFKLLLNLLEEGYARVFEASTLLDTLGLVGGESASLLLTGQ